MGHKGLKSGDSTFANYVNNSYWVKKKKIRQRRKGKYLDLNTDRKALDIVSTDTSTDSLIDTRLCGRKKISIKARPVIALNNDNGGHAGVSEYRINCIKCVLVDKLNLLNVSITVFFF